MPCVRINAPEWFGRADWQAFLDNQQEFSRLATWHERGKSPNEFSDVFVTYDGGEGSDAEEIPADIWLSIRERMESLGIDFAVLWITNLDV
jgi:hypothetical protein